MCRSKFLNPTLSQTALDICVNCFILGEEFSNHKNNMDYHVINKLNFPLFVNVSLIPHHLQDWTAEEELYLFEGLERFGFGNWSDIADHIATDK